MIRMNSTHVMGYMLDTSCISCPSRGLFGKAFRLHTSGGFPWKMLVNAALRLLKSRASFAALAASSSPPALSVAWKGSRGCAGGGGGGAACCAAGLGCCHAERCGGGAAWAGGGAAWAGGAVHCEYDNMLIIQLEWNCFNKWITLIKVCVLTCRWLYTGLLCGIRRSTFTIHDEVN